MPIYLLRSVSWKNYYKKIKKISFCIVIPFLSVYLHRIMNFNTYEKYGFDK